MRLWEKIQNNGIYVIAEMSANHGGSLDQAREIVEGAAKAGADCLKIQTYTADSLTIDCDREDFIVKGGLWHGYKLYDLYQEASTPYAWHGAIKAHCEALGMDFLSTPFAVKDVDFLESLEVEAYKIASFELVDIPLMEYVASKKKPMIISTGMANREEIEEAVEACRRMGNTDLVLLKCCSEYPARWEDMGLGDIPWMAGEFGLPVGLSDHSMGSLAAVSAVALGACVIEKHIKKEGIDSVDAKFSMDLEDFAQMVQDVRNAKTLCRPSGGRLTDGEESSRVFRRSLYCIRDMEAGEAFAPENLGIIRPGGGLPPKHYREILGRKCARALVRGEALSWEAVER